MDKLKIIYFFLSILFVLFILNISIGSRERNIPKNGLSFAQIDSVFLFHLNEYGINSKWVQKKNGKKYSDSLKSYYKVKLPKDVNIPEFINSFVLKFNPQKLKFKISELKINGKTEILGFADNKLKFKALVDYAKNLQRRKITLSFLISDFADLSNSDKSELLSAPFPITLILVPSKESAEFISEINRNKKAYSVLINDDLTESDFKLNDNLPKLLLKNSIKNIKKNFSAAKIYLVDKKSNLYNSATFSFIKNEFKRNKITLNYFNQFILLFNKSIDEIISILKFHYESNDLSVGRIFILTANKFLKLKKKLGTFRKKGIKFVFPEQISN